MIGLGKSTRGLDCPHMAADSIDRRNALAKSFCWRLEAECLSWPFVQPASDSIEFVLVNIGLPPISRTPS
jgi:hypothetical protein